MRAEQVTVLLCLVDARQCFQSFAATARETLRAFALTAVLAGQVVQLGVRLRLLFDVSTSDVVLIPRQKHSDELVECLPEMAFVNTQKLLAQNVDQMVNHLRQEHVRPHLEVGLQLQVCAADHRIVIVHTEVDHAVVAQVVLTLLDGDHLAILGGQAPHFLQVFGYSWH